jgi:3'-phosphoadenosine 5'-phosphosulfate sulfotransferase (PAPS reductase)/FAD synthetase
MVTLTQQELIELKNFANEIPTKYGLPILQFLQQKEQEQKEQEPKEQEEVTN